MTTPDDTTRALRSLDVADQALDADQRRRAAATLEAILATDPAAPGQTAPERPRRRHRRLLLAGALAAVAGVAAVAVPAVTGRSEAFASWSPTPVELTGPERAAAVDACLVLQGGDPGGLALDPAADASVLVAEARGGWSYVLFTVAGLSQPLLQGSCLMPDDLVDEPVAGRGGFFGSLGGADETPSPAPRRDEVRQDEYAAGSVDDDVFVHVEGRAGRDVVGIEVTTPSGRTAEASVDNGRWAVWWPAGHGSMEDPDLEGAPTYEVTLRDGTVTDDVRGAG